MKLIKGVFYAAVLSLSFATVSHAQAHRGELDTDGVLSPGEIPNPRINYRTGHYKDGRDYGRPGEYREWDRYRDNRWHGRDENYYTPGFEREIIAGARSGRLSAREEHELRDLDSDLRRREEQYRRDGVLSNWERDDLEGRRNDLRKKYEHEMNDGERRWG